LVELCEDISMNIRIVAPILGAGLLSAAALLLAAAPETRQSAPSVAVQAAPEPASGAAAPAAGRGLTMVVHKDPYCGCCDGWIEHFRLIGYAVETRDHADMNAVKDRYGVPPGLSSCHTVLVDGYVLEGHVPAEALERLLAERPRAAGIAVPGMPVGSVGMEVEGIAPDLYDVVLFGPDGEKPFARFRGRDAVEG
jgi:hypothetical protein